MISTYTQAYHVNFTFLTFSFAIRKIYLTLQTERCKTIRDNKIIEALCLLLVSEKPRKLISREQEMAKGFHVYSVGLLYPYLFSKVFLAPSL